MKTGYDARIGANLTVPQYFDKYGPKNDEFSRPRTRPSVICPACSQVLHTVGETGGSVDGNWAHPRDPGHICPIKDSGASKYELLRPRAPNPAAAAALRRSFFEHWQAHWSFARSLAPFADIEGFSGFIRYADRTDLWAYTTLREWHLPYVFLSTCEFPPPTGKASSRRTEWLRFRFDSKVRTIEDLWIRVIPDLRFLKLRYRKPRSGSPLARHYIDSVIYTPDASWMATHTTVPPHVFAVGHMHAEFPAELGRLPV